VILTLVTLLVGGIAAILDSTMVTLAVHTLTRDLNANAGTIQWVTTAYLLAMAVAIPLTGWLERRLGGKRSWVLALSGFLLGSVLCACAWNAGSLIAFRAVQGLAGGLIMPLMMTLAMKAAGGKASTKLMASISIPTALGPILGPVIAGIILNSLSWRWLFLVNVPMVGIGLLLAWRYLKADATPETRTRIDWVGLVLLAPGLVGILYGLSQLSHHGTVAEFDVLAPLIVGLGLTTAFVIWALRAAHPLVDVRLLRFRSLGSASAVMFTAGAALYAGMFLLPLYFQQAQGKSVLTAGLLMIPQGVGALTARTFIGALVDRFGARAVTMASFGLTAVATIPFAFADSGTSLVWLGAVLLIRGVGVGALLIPPMATAYRDVPHEGISHASMATRITQQVGASFGTAVVAVVLQLLMTNGSTHAFATTFWWSIGITLVAFIPAAWMPGKAAPAGGR
jgi:EmrB/QacA subfamily drug resistance transporter